MKNFIERWLNRGDEKSDSQKFWIEFLHEVCGVDNPTELIEFEKRVELVCVILRKIPDIRIVVTVKQVAGI